MPPKKVVRAKPAAAEPAAERPGDEEQEEAAVPREPAVPELIKTTPSVSAEYICGQRVYTTWAGVPGASRRVLAPARQTPEKAEADGTLLVELASIGPAGEAIAAKWRSGEITDKEAAQQLKVAPREVKGVAAAGVRKKPAAAGRSGRGRGRGRGPAAEEDDGGEEAGTGDDAAAEEEDAEPAEGELPVLKKPAGRGAGGGRGAGRGRGRGVLKRPAAAGASGGSGPAGPAAKKRAVAKDDEEEEIDEEE